MQRGVRSRVGSRGRRAATRWPRLWGALLAALLLATGCTSSGAPSHGPGAVLVKGAGAVRLGNLRVELPGSKQPISVAAPELTAAEYGGLRGWLGSGALIGAPVVVTTTGPVPAGGVQLTRTYAAALPADAAVTLAYFNPALQAWVAVPSQLSADRRSVTAHVTHLSLWDDIVATRDQTGQALRSGLAAGGQAVKDAASAVYDGAKNFSAAAGKDLQATADTMYYAVGKAFDVRVDAPTCDGAIPSWVDNTVSIEANKNNSVLWCVGHDPSHPELLVVKARVNRGFALFGRPSADATWTYDSTFDPSAFQAALAAVTDLDGTLAQSVAALTGPGVLVGAGQEIDYGFSEAQVAAVPLGRPLVSLAVPGLTPFLATAAAQLLVQQGVGLADGMLASVIAVASCAKDVGTATDALAVARALVTCVGSGDELIAKRVGLALLRKGMQPEAAGRLAGSLVGKISVALGLIGPAFNAMNYAAERATDQAARDLTAYLKTAPRASVAKTSVVVLNPFRPDGSLDPGYSLDEQQAGGPPVDCSYDQGSEAATSRGTHSCGDSADATNACWAPPSLPGQVACMVDPWSKKLVVRTATNISPTGRPPTTLPLGIELSDGTRWLLRNGGSWGGRADGLVGAYGCASSSCNNAATGKFLAVLTEMSGSAIDESREPWTVRIGELGEPNVSYPAPKRLAVTTAWFIASTFR